MRLMYYDTCIDYKRVKLRSFGANLTCPNLCSQHQVLTEEDMLEYL